MDSAIKPLNNQGLVDSAIQRLNNPGLDLPLLTIGYTRVYACF